MRLSRIFHRVKVSISSLFHLPTCCKVCLAKHGVLAKWIVLIKDLFGTCAALTVGCQVWEKAKDDILKSVDVDLRLLHSK